MELIVASYCSYSGTVLSTSTIELYATCSVLIDRTERRISTLGGKLKCGQMRVALSSATYDLGCIAPAKSRQCLHEDTILLSLFFYGTNILARKQ